MKYKVILVLCLLAAAALVLSGCAGKQETFDVYGSTPTATPISQTQFTANNIGQTGGLMDQNPYDTDDWGDEDWSDEDWSDEDWGDDGEDWGEDDPYAQDALSEEDFSDPSDSSFYETAATPVSADATVYPYAGTTPILLDPIDKPTPTPKVQFTLSYTDYTSTKLGLSFKGPVGWILDESQDQVCTLSEPDYQMKDGQRCIIRISAEPTSSNYSEGELKTHVKQCLNTIGSEGFTKFEPSLTATRHMMGEVGVYANYKATRKDGVEIGGRIQYTCINKTLYGLEIVYPYGFKASYEPAFGEVRSSLSLIK